MASVPATTELSIPQTNPTLALPGSDFLRGAMRLPVARQVGLLVAICASVAIGAASVLWMRSDAMKQLVTLDNPVLASEVIAALDSAAIDYVLDDKAGLLVPAKDYHRARLQIGGVEGVGSDPLGYELLDREQGLGQSQLMEAVQHRRGLEGELARSIQRISVIQAARVLIAQPPQSAFLRNRRAPSASVALTLKPGRSLTEEQIRAITSLVAGAVPELKPEDVSVVDQAGRLLTAELLADGLGQSLKELDYVERIEARLKRNVYNLLVPTLGPQGFSTEVVAEVDFTRAEEAAELYQPDVTSVRSERSLEEVEVGDSRDPIGVPGALANEPVIVDAAEAEEVAVVEEPRRTRSEVTRNFEVDRTVSYTRKPVATVRRVSVSVVVRDRPPLPAVEEGGEPVPNPWSAEELRAFEQVVRAGIGFDEARNDQVMIISQPFTELAPITVAAPAFYEQSWFSTLVKQVLGGLVLLVLMIGLLRPLLRNISQAGAIVKEQQALALARMAEEQAQEREAALRRPEQNAQNAQNAMLGKDATVALLPGESSVGDKLGNIRELVQGDPERAAQVVKHWVGQDE